MPFYTHVRMEQSQDENNKPLLITSAGEKIHQTENAIIIILPPDRSVLSTARVGGGYRTDLQAVYNHQPSHQAISSNNLEEGSVEAYLEITARRLQLNPEKSAGLITAACMKHAAVVTESFRGLEVTAIITAGIEVNGGRAGDPASYYQESGTIERVGGTINTILLIGADLPEMTMVRALVTATEAKTAALQEIMASSRYSSGIATGSGTDGIAIISDRSSRYHLTDAGKHSKLGELLGRTVINGTKQALNLQSGLNSFSQRDFMARIARFGITEEDIWKRSTILEGENRKSVFISTLRTLCLHPGLVAVIASILHLQDEINWGLIPEAAGVEASLGMITSIPSIIDIASEPELSLILKKEESVLHNLVHVIAWTIKRQALK